MSLEVTRTVEFCGDCFEHTMHLRSVDDSDDGHDFTACGECGKLLDDDAFTLVRERECECSSEKTNHLRVNTVITGVERGFIKTRKIFACIECGETR